MKIPDSLKKAISSKVLKKSESEGVSKVSGLKDTSNISKNFAFLPSMAKDLNIARQNIFKLVKLEGGNPVRASNVSSGETQSPTPMGSQPAGTSNQGGMFGISIMDLLNPRVLLAKISIEGIIVAVGLVYLFKDVFVQLAESIFGSIKESFSEFTDYLKQMFADFVQPILDGLTKVIDEIFSKVKDFFKPIFEWVGEKIKSIIEFLQPVFTFMKSVFDKVMVVIAPLKSVYEGLQNQIKEAASFLREQGAKNAKAEAPPGFEYDAEGGLQESAEERQKKSRAAAAAKAAKDAKAAAEAKAAKDKASTPSSGERTSGGRGGQGGPSAAEIAKKDLTPSQLKWLGNADPTDPYIMARLPPPQPGEKGGPPKPTPEPTKSPAAAPATPTPSKKPDAGAGAPVSGGKELIIFHEGKAKAVPGGYKPYQDTKGYWTIGVGHLITKDKNLPPEYDRVFTEAEVMKMFNEDYKHHAAAAAKIPGFNLLNESGQLALIDLTFNMGNDWYKKFPATIKALAAGDFKTAADELVNSDWYKQVKGRAVTIVSMIRNGGKAGPIKGETQTAAAPAPAPTPAPAKASTPEAPKLPPTPTPTAQPSTESASAGAASLSQVTTAASGVEAGKFSKSFEERFAMMAAAFKAETGKKLLITSGFRTNEEQKVLFDAKVKELGGDEAAAAKLVARPAPPLGRGKGSLHAAGLAADVNSKGAAGINRLAGTWDKPTGWLEKFGLTRPVPKENWHIQAIGTAPTSDNPDNPGKPSLVPNKDGKATDVSDGDSKPVKTGEKISSASTELAADQRSQQKPGTPTYVDASTTNNTQVTKNENGGSKKQENTNNKLLERVT